MNVDWTNVFALYYFDLIYKKNYKCNQIIVSVLKCSDARKQKSSSNFFATMFIVPVEDFMFIVLLKNQATLLFP
jgi:hypothetical protein